MFKRSLNDHLCLEYEVWRRADDGRYGARELSFGGILCYGVPFMKANENEFETCISVRAICLLKPRLFRSERIPSMPGIPQFQSLLLFTNFTASRLSSRKWMNTTTLNARNANIWKHCSELFDYFISLILDVLSLLGTAIKVWAESFAAAPAVPPTPLPRARFRFGLVPIGLRGGALAPGTKRPLRPRGNRVHGDEQRAVDLGHKPPSSRRWMQLKF